MSFVPRGGGGFGGGRGGGGGFRGGGFRGGSRSFRVGSVRSSGRPFGRTGSRRTVSRAPRGRNYHRPHHRRYWGGYHRPWWRRPWHWYWWWGRPYRPWYYAPVYWGGGAILLIVALLIIIPVVGFMVIPYPFSNADAQGTITYRDTQTLWYNEYWYEKEHMSAGQSIDYNMQSIPGEVTFLIWDQPFENFPDTKTLTGSYQESLTVEGDHDYEYLGYFLKTGSQLTYNFNITSGGPIEFFIADANDLNRWNNWETIYTTVSYTGSEGDSGSFDIPYSQDWYLVWYNSGSSPVQLDLNVDYTAVGAFDFSNADVVVEGVDNVPSSTFVVPSTGDWYFFIYFDPFVNSAESVDITFNVSYNTNVSSNDRWIDLTPVLVFIGIIIVFLLIVAVIQRRSAKKTAAATATTAVAPTTPSTTAVPTEAKKCHRCNSFLQAGDIFCNNCGAKITGRDYGVSKVTTPSSEKNCRSCGKPLIPDSRFCKHCGAKIEQEVKKHKYFPDERDAFFCQLDNEKHPSTDSAYECDQCSRMICGDCYDNITQTGVSRCPYCKGELSKVQ